MSMRSFIIEHREELLEHCLRGLRASHPERSDAELLDNLPRFLDELVRALDEDIGAPMARGAGHTPEAASHGRQRITRGFDITAIASDYGLFSDAVGEVGSRYGEVFPPREYQVLNATVDGHIAAALEDYWASARQEIETRANEVIGFLAHELRNTASAARLAFEVLREGHVGLQSRTAQILERNLERMEYLVAHAVATVKLRADMPAEVAEVDLLRVVHEVVQSIQPERGIVIDVEAPPTVTVIADEQLLNSAVHNLVQNAVKYSRDRGRVTVRITLDAESCAIAVADQCGGLPSGDPEELFRTFVRRSRDRGGVGLGLAIARQAIRAHGGDLSVTDRPGHGCTFEIRLPRRPA